MISKNNLLQKVQLKEKSIAELEKLYENLTTKNDYDFTTVIEVLISKYQLEKDNMDRVEKLQIEQLVSNIRKDNTTNNRFPSLKRPEIITIFTEEKIQYLKNRVSQTSNMYRASTNSFDLTTSLIVFPRFFFRVTFFLILKKNIS